MSATVPGRRWAVEHVKPRSLTVTVRHFSTLAARDAWVAENPNLREGVSERNVHVRAHLKAPTP